MSNSRHSVIEDVDNDYRSNRRSRSSVRIEDPLLSHSLNSDEPRPTIQPSRGVQTLLGALKQVDSQSGIRIPLSANSAASFRIVPDDTAHSRPSTVREYKPRDISPTTRPDDALLPTTQAYIWRQKFIRLNRRNPDIEIPDTNDPKQLEILYTEALKTHHHNSSSATWLLYMSFGYAGFQWLLKHVGLDLGPDFVGIQMTVMSHYTEILKQLGDPGGPSIGSSWPAWLKLVVIVTIHTIVFILIFKITGSSQSAREAQLMVCKTGIMGGSKQGDEVAADTAMTGVGGLLGNLVGGGVGGGIGNFIGNIFRKMGGRNEIDNIDINNPPLPVSKRETQPQGQEYSSTRKTPFDN